MQSDLGTARARPVPSDKTRYNFSAVTRLLPLFSSQCKSHPPACSPFYNPQPLPVLHFCLSTEETNRAADLSFGNSLCLNASTIISTRQVHSPKKEKHRHVFLDQCITTGCDFLFSRGWDWWLRPQGWGQDRQVPWWHSQEPIDAEELCQQTPPQEEAFGLYSWSITLDSCQSDAPMQGCQCQGTANHPSAPGRPLLLSAVPWYEIPSCSIFNVKFVVLAVPGKFWDLGLSLDKSQAEFFNW